MREVQSAEVVESAMNVGLKGSHRKVPQAPLRPLPARWGRMAACLAAARRERAACSAVLTHPLLKELSSRMRAVTARRHCASGWLHDWPFRLRSCSSPRLLL